jgi:hypothetical protein
MEWWQVRVNPVMLEMIEPLEVTKQAHSLEPTVARRPVSPSLPAPKQQQVTLQWLFAWLAWR